MLIVLAFAAIVFLVLGVSFVLRDSTDTPDPATVTSREEVERLEKNLSTSLQEEGQLRQRLDALVLELDRAKAGLAEAKEQSQEAETLKKKLQEYEDRVRELAQSLEYLRQKANQQAQEAVTVFDQLQVENEKLKGVAEQAKVAESQAAAMEQLQREKGTLEDKIKANSAQINVLETALNEARQQTQEGITAKQEADTLRTQNEGLKVDLSKVGDRIAALETEAERARAEKDSEVQKAQAAVEQLKSTLSAITQEKEKNDDEVRRLQQAVDQAREQMVRAQDETKAPADWEEERLALEKSIQDLKSLNERLLSRDKLLQNELTRSRAQAIGLEKVCQQFKKQLSQSQDAGNG